LWTKNSADGEIQFLEFEEAEGERGGMIVHRFVHIRSTRPPRVLWEGRMASSMFGGDFKGFRVHPLDVRVDGQKTIVLFNRFGWCWGAVISATKDESTWEVSPPLVVSARGDGALSPEASSGRIVPSDGSGEVVVEVGGKEGTIQSFRLQELGGIVGGARRNEKGEEPDNGTGPILAKMR
jgi:hypothetical protein